MTDVLAGVERRARASLRPPRKRTASQWADEERFLSPESSASPGRWVTSRMEPSRGIMDAAAELSIEVIVVMAAGQVAKTESLNNIMGCAIDQDPGPMLVIHPTVEMGQAWSKDRLEPMIRDTPALTSKVAEKKERGSKNTIRHKTFPGGHLTVGGANSPAGLASRPIRYIFADEVDRYPLSAGTEGDPVSLARKRTATFWNRKIILTSTPTIKGMSRIEAEFELSDKRRFFVPCPDCGHEQILRWAQVKWPENKPEEAYYVCEECGSIWNDAQRNAAVKKGRWIPTALGNGTTAGFHISELYSPWSTLGRIARAFIEAKGNPEKLKTWVNTSLGDTWQDSAGALDPTVLAEKVEDWAVAPAAVLLITAGVDVQPDRLEIEKVGWGVGEESWSLDHQIFYGDPNRPDVWKDLDTYLAVRTELADGRFLPISATCVDTGGANTQAAYAYCRPRFRRRIYAIKGASQQGRPVWPKRASKKNKGNVNLFLVGVSAAKDVVIPRLKLQEPGPGYCHFPNDRDPEYFRQLAAERVLTRYVKGFTIREYVKDAGARNEALDCRVYAYAALVSLNVRWAALAAKAGQQRPEPAHAPTQPDEPPPAPAAGPPKPKQRRGRAVIRSNFTRR